MTTIKWGPTTPELAATRAAGRARRLAELNKRIRERRLQILEWVAAGELDLSAKGHIAETARRLGVGYATAHADLQNLFAEWGTFKRFRARHPNDPPRNPDSAARKEAALKTRQTRAKDAADRREERLQRQIAEGGIGIPVHGYVPPKPG